MKTYYLHQDQKAKYRYTMGFQTDEADGIVILPESQYKQIRATITGLDSEVDSPNTTLLTASEYLQALALINQSIKG